MVQQQYDVTPQDIVSLKTPEQITLFFARLGYVVTETADLSPQAMDALKYQLHKNSELVPQITTFWQVAKRRDETYDEFFVYLYVLSTLNEKAINRIFLDLCKLQGQFLLVLTNETYSELNFLYIDRFIGNPTSQKKSSQVRLMPLFDLAEISTTPLPGRISGNARLTARNRMLTVKRSDPATNKVALRVLNRLAWRNNRDIAAQCAVLRSAFDIAAWSQKYFNNRALFSDYYLNENLPQDETWKNTRKDEYEARKMHQAYAEMRVAYEKMEQKILDLSLSAQELRTTFTEAVLGWLGFAVQHGSKSTKQRAPDYLLSTQDVRGNRKQRVAFCLAYAWDRNLDTYADEVNDLGEEPTDPTAFENPGAVVVTLFDTAPVEWAILTNGKTWRLYSARTHNRATNYYEIDLAELLALPRDPDSLEEMLKAFRYFWLLFRADAFDARPQPPKYADTALTFLDYLLKESHSYALQLGASLKDKIFEQVFAYFAEGLLTDAWNAGTLPQDLALYRAEQQQQLLKPFFNATLTFLYRLLFVLYAESRNLLPVADRGYKPHSLEHLKSSIADEIGNNEEQAVDAIERTYKHDSYRFYAYLAELFHAIDKGDAAFNVPTYNGGLFQTQVTRTLDDWRSFDATDTTTLPPIASATPEEILALHRIDDRRLALGLDKLARDEEQKEHKLMPVDYKSLGVRQLGSIYEGLLEFKLRVALQDMVEIKGKIVPRAEAIAQGQYKPGRHVEYPARKAYIENDRHERKVTGSYYTPDYIVEYIVEQTLGPVISQKEDDLRKEFRLVEQNMLGAQRRNRNLQTQSQGAVIHPVESKLQAPELVDKFFDIKVLDPAMGSGHFLVEAVDYITRRMIAFLAQIPHNPVRYAIKQIERDIAEEADKQHIVIDRDQLTEINLLKRQVLKRCIYGVDLNNMAVELAKVSVWLDSFTVGAPLSFLDHHLRYGNSLLGVRIDDLRAATSEGQLSLFHGSSLWLKATFATKAMIKVGKLGDSTISQARESKNQYGDALDALRPHKRMLDIYLSRWYGNEVTKGKVKGKLRLKAADVDKALDFLRHENAEKWLEDPASVTLNEEQEVVMTIATQAAETQHFFHWDLEFPEVFIDPVTSEIKKNGGFNAVIGNPPYVRQEGLGKDKDAFEGLYKDIFNSIADLYTYFIHRGNSLLAPGGRFGMITANKFMRANYGAALRTYLIENEHLRLEKLIDFGDLPVFGDATTYPIILITTHAQRQAALIEYARLKELPATGSLTPLIAQSTQSMPESAFQGTNWSLAEDIEQVILNKLHKNSLPLKEYLGQIEIRRGILTGFNEAFIIDRTTRDKLIAEDARSAEIIKPLLVGENVKCYIVDFQERYLIWTYVGVPINQYPAIYRHLQRYQPQLEKRYDKGHFWWELRHCSYYEDFEKPKIAFPDIAVSTRFAYADFGEFVEATAFIIPINNLYLLSLLNSNLFLFYIRYTSSTIRGDFLRFKRQYVEPFPIHRINTPTPQAQRNTFLQESQQYYEQYLQLNQRSLPRNTPPM